MIRLATRLAVAGSLLRASSLGAQAGAADTVVVEQRVLLAGEMTQADARRRAIEGALAEAVRRVTGVHVQSQILATKEERNGIVRDEFVSVVQLDAGGRAVGYDVLRDEWVTTKHPELGPQLYYLVALRVAVARDVGVADAGFRVSLTVNNDVLRARSRPTDGDELVATVSASERAAVTLISIADDSARVLFPNDYVPMVTVDSAPSELPAAEWRARGLRLRPALPTGTDERRELLLAVATRSGVAPFRGGTVLELQRWLASIRLDKRALSYAVVNVRRAER